MRRIIKNAKYFGRNGEVRISDLYIDGNTFVEAFEMTDETDVISLNGEWVFPSFIDMHVHLRTPGFEQKEDLVTGTHAAAHGGYTTVCCMPNTKPCLDKKETIEALNQRVKKEACIEVLPFGAITIGSQSKELTDHDALIQAGCVGLSDDGRTTMDIEMMKEALDFSEKHRVLVSTHSEDHSVETSKAVAAPQAIENDIIHRDIALCREVGGHLHIGHISTSEGVSAVRKAKDQNVKVSCEVTPHHLLLATENINTVDAKYKVNPPLRQLEDNEALIEAMNDGTIDVIATDHAPHEAELKHGSYENGAFGFTGIELAFSSIYSRLVKTDKVSLHRLVDMMTNAPRRLINRPFSYLDVGDEASIVIIDTKRTWIVTDDSLLSKGKNTPFKGEEFYGVTLLTMHRGEVVYKEAALC